MTATNNRNNDYWAGRLEKDGHTEILERYQAGEVSMYRARQEAGYLKKKPKSPAAKLHYHWQRASHGERKRFVMAHLKEVNRVIKDVAADLRDLKAKQAKKPGK